MSETIRAERHICDIDPDNIHGALEHIQQAVWRFKAAHAVTLSALYGGGFQIEDGEIDQMFRVMFNQVDEIEAIVESCPGPSRKEKPATPNVEAKSEDEPGNGSRNRLGNQDA